MTLDELRNREILLLGRSRALQRDEFEMQLAVHGITLAHTDGESAACIVEGRMPNPLEQDDLARLYAQGRGPIIEVDTLERLLCEAIDDDRLLMSLKLGGDRERLHGFLQNALISNTLFLKLLSLYDWGGEGFFDNDENRDVTAALIGRFYENIERNHNVQYAASGLLHLITQSEDAVLIEAIASLSPLKKALKSRPEGTMLQLLQALSLHEATPQAVLKRMIASGNRPLCMLIAQREGLSTALQQSLLALEDDAVNESLSHNGELDTGVAAQLEASFGENLAGAIRLDAKRFNRYAAQWPEALAANESLDTSMQHELLASGSRGVKAVLAANRALTSAVAEALFREEAEVINCSLAANAALEKGLLEKLYECGRYAAALASNLALPEVLLTRLWQSGDAETLKALAKNPSTPVEVLYQLGLDMRYERYVKENPSYGRHIQTDNIGWL